MTKASFVVEDNQEGNKCLKEAKTEKTKNHQGGAKQTEQDYSSRAMYGSPVDVYLYYLQKLHQSSERLFQKPKQTFSKDHAWFGPTPVGKNPLGSMMQSISRKAGLGKVYTCHSVRASMITTLFHKGISPQIIMQMTKHRNESSLKHYIGGLSVEQNVTCNTILQEALQVQPPEKVLKFTFFLFKNTTLLNYL